ncbi:class I SAM-dependent methyltransferase [Isoptericola croceus]|uniref:class I SAM-dependent methyltransferase n=1 Tax=Isoptericola croceus TaxID=3031406 RepID=UPI0023F779FB|nr:class I SAM-dependent methyltransferase [Isoptericola croceus]
MARYEWMYRWGIRPWEKYPRAAATSIDAHLDAVEGSRSGARGRALDLGCGRGLYTLELARRGWQAVGVDLVPRAVEEARRRDRAGIAEFAVADVTALGAADLGAFDLFLDIGCFQGLDADQRAAMGHGVTASAREGAVVLILAFGVTRWRSQIGGVSAGEVVEAFPG